MTARCPHYDTARVMEFGRWVCGTCGTRWSEVKRERRIRDTVAEINADLQAIHAAGAPDSPSKP